MTDAASLLPNHHADYPQFNGVFGYLAGVTMTVGRTGDARLVAQMAALSGQDAVVDIGCGPGTAARVAARRGATVTGVDPSAPMLRLAGLLSLARSTDRRVTWLRNGAEALDVADASVSVCWSVAAVHHWPDLEAGIAEVRRVLAPDGTFIALEARTKPGASSRSSHGWTDQQAELFAHMLRERRFKSAEVAYHRVRRNRRVVTVSASV